MWVTFTLVAFAVAGVVAWRLLQEQINDLYDILIDLEDDGYRPERDIWPR
jgi:4-hydroxybenzoate polyprenyltransferase